MAFSCAQVNRKAFIFYSRKIIVQQNKIESSIETEVPLLAGRMIPGVSIEIVEADEDVF